MRTEVTVEVCTMLIRNFKFYYWSLVRKGECFIFAEK